MFGGPLFGPDVQPAQATRAAQSPVYGPPEPPLAGPEGAQQQPYGFEQALSDVLDFIGLGGTEQAQANQLAAEDEAYSAGQSPYQPTESANIMDRRAEQPRPIEEAYKRFGSTPKEAAARISLMPRGVVPFLSAAYDTYTDKNNPQGLGLSALYRQRQMEADALEKDQAPATSMVRSYFPVVAGGLTALAAPARSANAMRSVLGTAARGAIVGGGAGATEGYFARKNDGFDLDDPRRLGQAAIMGGLGMAGGALGAGVTRGVAMPVAEAVSGLRGRAMANQTRQPAQMTQQAPSEIDARYYPNQQIGANWDRPTGPQMQEEVFNRRFDRELPRMARQMGMSPDELKQRIAVSRAGGDFNAPLQPRQPAQAAPAPAQVRGPVPEQPVPAPAQVPATPKQPKEPKPPKGPISKSEFARYRASARGQDAMADIKRQGLEKQTRSDAQMLGNEVRPISDVTGVRSNVRITRDQPSGEVRFNAPRERASYAPKQKKGVMEIADEITASNGRSPGKWDTADREAFIKAAARHTSMSPAKIKSMLASYGEGARAKRNLSNARVRELVEGERIKARNEK